MKVSWDCIKDLHKIKLEMIYRKIFLQELVYVSVDEIAIAKGHEYMTIFLDVKSERIIHAVEGKDIAAVTPFLKQLYRKAINLKAIVMDMSPPFTQL